jgi:hypothetical protein
MTACDWERCKDAATHTLRISFPDTDEEKWNACRPHDRLLKLQAVRSRPRATAPTEKPASVTVQCGRCQRPLEESSNLLAEERQPCPDCGSIVRRKNVVLTARLTLCESLRVRAKDAGKGDWRVDTRTGDDYTRDLNAWGRLERTMDRGADLYHEVIELYDGTRIISTARLSDH